MKTATCEKLIERIRSRIFCYSDSKQEQATRILGKLKARCAPAWNARYIARLDYPE